MPSLIKLYIRQSAIGFGLSAIFVAALLWFDVANLGHLVTHSPSGGLAVLLLWFFNGIVFASVQFGIAIMRMSDDDDLDGGRAARGPVATTTPARVPVGAEQGGPNRRRIFHAR